MGPEARSEASRKGYATTDADPLRRITRLSHISLALRERDADSLEQRLIAEGVL